MTENEIIDFIADHDSVWYVTLFLILAIISGTLTALLIQTALLILPVQP